MSGLRQALPRGPASATISQWDTHSGTFTPVHSISFRATHRKLASTGTSSNTISNRGHAPRSCNGRCDEQYRRYSANRAAMVPGLTALLSYSRAKGTLSSPLLSIPKVSGWTDRSRPR